MNLFENILAKSNPLPDVKSQFMSGFQQSQPQPQIVQQKKPTMSLFSDEVSMLGRMKADGLDDAKSMNLLKKRRSDLLGGNTQLDEAEKSMLLKMQADNLSAKDATALIKKRRADQFEKKYQEGNILQKGAYNALMLGAGATEKTLKYAGNILDFATLGMAGFGEDVKRMEQVTQSPEFDSTAFKAGQVLPDIALAVSPIGGGYLAGARGMTGLQGAKVLSTQGAKNLSKGLMGRSAVVGAGFGATQPILDQGSDATMGDIATGAAIGGISGAVAAPVIGKVLKYGQAGYRGGLTGMGKSIARDTKAGIQSITPSGANISTKANRFNANEIREFTKTTGQSPGDFATSRGMTKVGDDAVVEATNLWKASKDQADEALQAIKGRFRFTDEGEDLLKTTIDDLETRLVNTKSPDSKRISQLKAKYEDSGLTMSEINEIKRAYSNNYKYSFVDVGSEAALRSRNLQDAVRKWQFKVAEENGLTNLKDINKTTQGWKMFADSLSKKIQGSSGNNNVSLTDWIALSGGSPENIALYLGKKLASSDKVKSGAIKLFSKKTKPSIIQASKADIQRANFLKDVNRGVSGVGDNSGGKSMVRPVGLLPAPSGKATGARNFRVNQPKEKTLIKNEGQVGARPTTPKKPEEQKLLPAPRIPAGTSLPRTDISAESMRGVKAKRPEGVTPKVVKPSPKPIVKNLQKTEKSATIGDMENPIVNKQTGETLNQAIEKLRKNNWSEKDISKFRESVLGKKESIVKKEGVLDTVNPTGGLFVDYTPSKRANSIISSKDLTTLDKTLGKSPDDYITIYRGTVKGQKEMNPGDFVTDMPELAKSYAGGDKIVISKRVKYSDVIDSIENGGANEYLYIPKEMQKWDNKTIVKPNTIKNESKVSKPISSNTIPEATPKVIKKPGIIEEIKQENNLYKQKKDIIEQIKNKEGERFAKKWSEQVDMLFPDKSNIVEYGKKGLTYKEGDKYFYTAFSNMDSPKWSKSFKMDVTKDFIDTIPEGYFKNAFGEIQKNPSNKKGGFIKIPEIGKKTPVKNPLVEEARKYKSAEEFEKALRSPRGIGYGGNMGILWRATSKPFKPNTKTIIEHGITDSGNTKSYAKDILLSNDYGKSEPYLISKDAKIASWREGNDVYKVTKESAFSKKSVEEFKRRGFDGFERGPDEIVIFNENKIKPFNINDFFTNYIK